MATGRTTDGGGAPGGTGASRRADEAPTSPREETRRVQVQVADDRQALAAEVARLQGALQATREHLAAAEALAQQLRDEVAAAREEGAAARQQVAQLQRHADDRVRTAERRADELRTDLEEERRRCREAEEERAALIGVLGRKARRRIGPPAG